MLTDFLKKIFSRNKIKKTEDELLINFLRKKKDILEKEMDKAMLKYVLEFFNFAKNQEKKKKVPISVFASRDFEIDQENQRKAEEEKNKLPHPVEIGKNSTWAGY